MSDYPALGGLNYRSPLKSVREEKGLSQAELAKASGVNVHMIQFYEQGVKDINKANVITVLSLSEALECDVYDIINPRGENKVYIENVKKETLHGRKIKL